MSLQHRLGPVAFGALAAPAGLTLFGLCRLVHATCWDAKRAQRRCLAAGRVVLRALLRGCFWLEIRDAPSAEDWAALGIPAEGGCFIMINHTSNLDGFLFCALASPSLIRRCKSLMVGRAFRTPLLGTIFRLFGHEPVHFLKDVDGAFSVDKAKMAPVNARVRAHVEAGGVLAFCPEGAINKGDPTRCLPLRRGSFQLALDLKLPIYGFSALGQHRFWPARAAPGQPAACRVGVYAVNAWNDRLAPGGKGVDGMTSTDVANLCQAAMQASVDDLAGKAAPAAWGKSLAAMN